jgi:pimeloyl-ACP methyl ester carboxylesterase
MSPEPCGKHINVVGEADLQAGAAPLCLQVATADRRVGGMLWEPRSGSPAAPLIVCVHGIGSNGRYFDLDGNSLARAATARGMAVLLIDRPGYGCSVEPSPGSAIDCGVTAIADLLRTVREQNTGLMQRPLILIGHSFGGAIAFAYTAAQPVGSVAALCVSGIGDRPDSQYLAEMQRSAADRPRQLSPHWFFGPGSSYDRHGVTALRAATEPQRGNEAQEVAYSWPERWPDIAPKISCPVHIRLAEFERIWESAPYAVERIATALTSSPTVDAAIAPDGGHLYEAHHRGPELIAAQLDFARNHAGKSA